MKAEKTPTSTRGKAQKTPIFVDISAPEKSRKTVTTQAKRLLKIARRLREPRGPYLFDTEDELTPIRRADTR